ncbi:amidase [Corynebacterium capitovis]|uniref:amidase n=1 Tax=Corynebacterium capitovis TaxID=131081 RepID=UPI00036C7B0F|nr:amidase [Corynebacterium capitovis]
MDEVDELRVALEGLGPEEHAFTHLDLSRRPTSSGRLTGWVISAKDLHDVTGMPTTLGSVQRVYTATTTDPFLASLEREGALIVGKSATPELGLTVDTEPVGLPHPVNPIHPGATPGGSSGGAAVQVARGLVRAAHASDGGGSIRVPAAACGVVGFKPAGTDLGVQGFITRTVSDAAFLHGLPQRPEPARVGVLVDPLFADAPIAPVMRRAVLDAARVLEGAGFETVALSPYPGAADTFAAFRTLFTSGFAELAPTSGYPEWVRRQGRAVKAGDLGRARAHAAALPELLAHQWQVDALLSPVLTTDPPPRGAFRKLSHPDNFNAQTRWSPWCSLFNVARLPALSLPWQVAGGPPVGIHLGGITLSDAALLTLARTLHP